jgi:hypothetical protein
MLLAQQLDISARATNETNIANLVDQFCYEADPERQKILEKLLTEEVTRFGQRGWQVDVIEHHVAQNSERIEAQVALIDRMEADGDDCNEAIKLLKNCMIIQNLFWKFRSSLLEALESNERFVTVRQRRK